MPFPCKLEQAMTDAVRHDQHRQAQDLGTALEHSKALPQGPLCLLLPGRLDVLRALDAVVDPCFGAHHDSCHRDHRSHQKPEGHQHGALGEVGVDKLHVVSRHHQGEVGGNSHEGVDRFGVLHVADVICEGPEQHADDH